MIGRIADSSRRVVLQRRPALDPSSDGPAGAAPSCAVGPVCLSPRTCSAAGHCIWDIAYPPEIQTAKPNSPAATTSSPITNHFDHHTSAASKGCIPPISPILSTLQPTPPGSVCGDTAGGSRRRPFYSCEADMTPAKKRWLAQTRREDPPPGMMFNPWGNEPRFVPIEEVERKSRERMNSSDNQATEGYVP